MLIIDGFAYQLEDGEVIIAAPADDANRWDWANACIWDRGDDALYTRIRAELEAQQA